MSGFTKLSSSIVHSTVWREPHTTRIVWITLLALADAEGYVGASVPGLADAARVTLAECEAALASFLGPDPYSRTKDHDGRRIEVAEGGWRLLNHALYRMGRDSDARRLQNREAKRRERERNHTSAADVLTDADMRDKSAGQPSSAQAEAEAEAEAEADLHPSGVGASPTKPTRRRRSTKWRKIPGDWQPNDEHRRIAAEEGRDFERELKLIRDHEYKSPRSDPDAAFRSWLRSAYGRGAASGGRNGAPVVQHGGVFREQDRGWLDKPGPVQPSHGANGAENAIIVKPGSPQ